MDFLGVKFKSGGQSLINAVRIDWFTKRIIMETKELVKDCKRADRA